MAILNLNKTKLLLLLNFFWAFPFLLLLRLINKFIKIQIIKIRSDRFGHFAPDGAEQVAKYQIKSRHIRIYIFDWIICNKKWAEMLSTVLPVYNFLRPVYFWNHFIPGNNEINQLGTETSSRDINLLFLKYNVKIPFHQSDDYLAINWLEKKGWKRGEKFYCLLIRDNTYLNKAFVNENIDWSYHNHRNSDLETYNKAISWLVNQGIWVIRMGKNVEKKLSVVDGKIIDYPFDKNKSDFLDTWLFANCNACITTGTGPDILSGIYGKNLLFLNFLPLASIRSDLNSITYPKTLVWQKNNKAFSLKDHLLNNRLNSNKYKNDKIKIIDMTETQILQATKEFYYYNNYNAKEKIDFKKQQDYFWDQLMLFNKKFNFKLHNKVHPYSNVSNVWLKSLEK